LGANVLAIARFFGPEISKLKYKKTRVVEKKTHTHILGL